MIINCILSSRCFSCDLYQICVIKREVTILPDDLGMSRRPCGPSVGQKTQGSEQAGEMK